MIVINDFMLKLGLSSNELFIYAVIYHDTQDNQKGYSKGIAHLSEITKIQERTIINNIKTLLEKGLIVKKQYAYNVYAYYAQIPQNVIKDNQPITKGDNCDNGDYDFELNNPDLAFDKNIHELFKLYEQNATDLIPLRFEKRNIKIFQLAKEYLRETNCDFEYFVELIKKANETKTILGNKIDFQALLKNHSRIYNDFYGTAPTKKSALDEKMQFFKEQLELERQEKEKVNE